MFSDYSVEYNGRIIQRLLLWILSFFIVAGVLVLGFLSSPLDDNGHPLLLTPRLAQIVRYHREIRKWAVQLQTIHRSLSEALAHPEQALFEQDQEVNRIYGDLLRIQREVDGTEVPLTMESLNMMMKSTLDDSIAAAQSTAAWVGEPSEAHHLQAKTALEAASEALGRLLINPWLKP